MSASGKFVLRIPPSLHQRMKEEALARKLSLNQLIVDRLMGRMQGEPQLLDTLRQVYRQNLLGVVLFGSVARGESRASSDIDLLVVLRDSRPVERSLYHLWDEKVLPTLGETYSPQFVHLARLPDVSSLWLEVAMEGEVLGDPDNVIRPLLRDIRAEIAAGRFLRKLSHGHPYWIRQESK